MSVLLQILTNTAALVIVLGAVFTMIGLVPRIRSPWASLSLGQAQRMLCLILGLVLIGAGVTAALFGMKQGVHLSGLAVDETATDSPTLAGKWRADVEDIEQGDEFKKSTSKLA